MRKLMLLTFILLACVSCKIQDEEILGLENLEENERQALEERQIRECKASGKMAELLVWLNKTSANLSQMAAGETYEIDVDRAVDNLEDGIWEVTYITSKTVVAEVQHLFYVKKRGGKEQFYIYTQKDNNAHVEKETSDYCRNNGGAIDSSPEANASIGKSSVMFSYIDKSKTNFTITPWTDLPYFFSIFSRKIMNGADTDDYQLKSLIAGDNRLDCDTLKSKLDKDVKICSFKDGSKNLQIMNDDACDIDSTVIGSLAKQIIDEVDPVYCR